MRRILAAMLVAAMLWTVGGVPAFAGEKQHSQSFYANWRSKHRVDAHTVDRGYWYLDAYRSGDQASGFIYHAIYRCTSTDGHRRCDRRFSESGQARGLTQGQFTIDRKLTSMHLAMTVRLRSSGGAVRSAEVTLDLAGVGDVTRAKESYSYRQGCELYKFSGRWRYRDGEGEPSIIVDNAALDVGKLRHVSIGIGDSISIVKEC